MPPKPPALKQLNARVAAFNAKCPIGTAVTRYTFCRPHRPESDKGIHTKTRSAAQVLGGHSAVVWVESHPDCQDLSAIEIDT